MRYQQHGTSGLPLASAYPDLRTTTPTNSRTLSTHPSSLAPPRHPPHRRPSPQPPCRHPRPPQAPLYPPPPSLPLRSPALASGHRPPAALPCPAARPPLPRRRQLPSAPPRPAAPAPPGSTAPAGRSTVSSSKQQLRAGAHPTFTNKMVSTLRLQEGTVRCTRTVSLPYKVHRYGTALKETGVACCCERETGSFLRVLTEPAVCAQARCTRVAHPRTYRCVRRHQRQLCGRGVACGVHLGQQLMVAAGLRRGVRNAGQSRSVHAACVLRGRANAEDQKRMVTAGPWACFKVWVKGIVCRCVGAGVGPRWLLAADPQAASTTAMVLTGFWGRRGSWYVVHERTCTKPWCSG